MKRGEGATRLRPIIRSEPLIIICGYYSIIHECVASLYIRKVRNNVVSCKRELFVPNSPVLGVG